MDGSNAMPFPMSEILLHRLAGARQCDSPNWNERPGGEISLIVIHGISLPVGHFGGDYVEWLFLNRLDVTAHADFADLAGFRVSSHLFIRRDGTVCQFVPFDKRAWHAGVSRYGERENCNDFSVGIELEGTDAGPYRNAQYECLVRVCDLLIDQYDIPLTHIVGHSDIAPGRKTDPGPGFDWTRFRSMLNPRRSSTG